MRPSGNRTSSSNVAAPPPQPSYTRGGFDWNDPSIDWASQVPPSGNDFPLLRPGPQERPQPRESDVVNSHNPTWIFTYPLPEEHEALRPRAPKPPKRAQRSSQEQQGAPPPPASIPQKKTSKVRVNPHSSSKAPPAPKESHRKSTVGAPRVSTPQEVPRSPPPQTAAAPTSVQTQVQTPTQEASSGNSNGRVNESDRLEELRRAQRAAEIEELDALALIAIEQLAESSTAGVGSETEPPAAAPVVSVDVSSQPTGLVRPSAAQRSSPPPTVSQQIAGEAPRAETLSLSSLTSSARIRASRRRGETTHDRIFGGGPSVSGSPHSGTTGTAAVGGRGGVQRREHTSSSGGPSAATAGTSDWEISDFSYENLLELGSMAVSTGLSKAQLAKYKPRAHVPPEEPVDCTICLETLVKGDPSLQISCGHSFHYECIVAWLRRCNKCPTCRFEIVRKE